MNKCTELINVKPCGVVYTGGDRQYYLIHPRPMKSANWESPVWARLVVVPRMVIGHNDNGNIYPHMRHIVTSDFTIDFSQLPEIQVYKRAEYHEYDPTAGEVDD